MLSDRGTGPVVPVGDRQYLAPNGGLIMTELHIGLIGAGKMGASLAAGVQAAGNATICAVADPAEGAAAALAEKLGDASISAHTDVAEMLARKEIEAVIVAVPNFLHAQVVRDACAAGKHVFCEKPMALNVGDARCMIETAEQNGVKLMIGQVLRYIPPYVWMIDLVTSGEIGEAFAVQVTRLDGGWAAGSYRVPWRMKKETCGGPLFEIAAHEIDFMRQVLGEAETVYASMDNYVSSDVDYEDLAHVLVNFQGGGRGCLLTGHCGFLGTYDGKIYCTEGSIFFDNKTGQVTYQRKGDDEPTVLPYAETGEGYEPGVQREVREFVEAVLGDTEPTIPGLEGLRNTEIAQAAHISAANNRVVILPL